MKFGFEKMQKSGATRFAENPENIQNMHPRSVTQFSSILKIKCSFFFRESWNVAFPKEKMTSI